MSYGVYGRGALQADVHDLLIFKNPVSVNEMVGVYFEDSNFALSHDITCYNQTSDYNVSGGFVCARYRNSNYGSLNNLQIEAPSIGVDIQGTSTNVEGSNIAVNGLFRNGNTIFMRDQSSGVNTIRRSPFAKSYGNVSEARPNLSGAIPVSTDTFQVFAGERYRVSIQVETTNGDVAGDALSTVYQSGGTAALHFGSTATKLIAREPIDARASVAQPASGVLSVVASGTLRLSVLTQLTRSIGSIAPNGAQLTIEAD